MKNQKIAVKIVGSVCILLTLVCSGIGVMSYLTAYSAIEKRVQDALPTMAEDAAKYIRATLDLYVLGIEGVAGRAMVRSMEWDKQEAALKEEIKRQGFLDMGIATPDGKTKYTDGSSADLGDRDYFKAAASGKTMMSDVIISRVTNKPVMILATPIKDGAKVIGVVIGRLDGALLSSITDKVRYGKSGYSYIINEKGALIAHDKREFVYEARNFLEEGKTKPEFKLLSEMMQRMVKGEKGFDDYTFMGSERYFGFAPVPGTRWSIAVGAIKNDVLSDVLEMRMKFITVSLCFLLFGAIVSYLLARSIANPVKKLMAAAIAVSQGDLSASSGLDQKDEIGILDGALKTMVSTLVAKMSEAEEQTALAQQESEKAHQATLEAQDAKEKAERAKAEGMLHAAHQLESVVEIVTSASEELSAQIDESSRGSEAQAHRVDETATAMEEMNATVLEVAKSASHAAQTADQAKAKAEEGSKIVDLVVKGIGDVQRQAQGMKTDMDSLGKQAEGIGQIMNVITDIADQTNLLALNAAIEAARAGEAGRGFAVVADEVRKLAEKTMTATKEVGDAIRGIQEGTRKNSENVDRSGRTIEEATSLANRSGDALKEIVSLVETTSDQVRSIATASEQQSSASEEINHSIEDVSRISSETSDAMRQSAQAVGELASQAQVLKNLIDQMKDEGGAGSGSTSANARKALAGART
ncbi:MAG: methyl-accepting chemotaxis protein [Desulfovibrio sp.]|nr:methyl-accepting chemotaxis protein [Desulfovibrio sp.]MBI4961463.1 methyl-accepting chemotaxis protein [Desulfovibrio sp.]